MKHAFLIILFLSVTTLTSAQDKRYFDSPFGAGGGFSPSWIVPNFSELNSKLQGFGVPELGSSGFFASGGTGFVYLSFIPNLRIGGIGFGGTTNSSAFKDGYEREIKYSSNFGGLTLEYSISISRDFAVSFGAIIGGSDTKIELFRNKSTFQWNDLWQEISDTSLSASSFSRQISKTSFLVAPTLNIDIPLYRFISFRVGAGYAFTFGENWKVDNDKEIFNTPSTLKGDAFFIQTGIFFGFFAY